MVKVAPSVTRVANGPAIYTNTAEATDNASSNYEDNNRPSLKVYTQPNMNVLVFEPTNFNDTRIAADALKASKAVLINYEKIEQSETSSYLRFYEWCLLCIRWFCKKNFCKNGIICAKWRIY